MTSSRPAVFLDRDGTILEERHYLSDPEQVSLVPGAAEAIASLQRAGYAVVVVTNQSGIGRGLYTEDDYRAVAARVDQLLAAAGASVDATHYCPHPPEPGGGCDCRKPRTGMYRRAAAELGLELSDSWYVGDKPTDLQPADALGGRGILVRTGYGSENEARVAPGTPVVDDVGAAARLILDGIAGAVDPPGGLG